MKKKGVIGIAGKRGPKENVKSALEYLDLSDIKDKSILIKPNVGRAAGIEHGYNTHPEAIAGVIEMAKAHGAKKIVIGESPIVGVNTFKAFQIAGVTDMAKRYDIELIDFDAKPPVKTNIPQPRVLKNTRIASEVFNYDILISVPVTKTHMHTGVTLGIKNFKGCLYRHEKVRYHQLEYHDKEYKEKTLDSAISDLATVLMPHLTVVDGYVGMEGLGPSGGEPIKSDFAVASWHALGADMLACTLMGIDFNEIPHLRLVSERNKLPFKLDNYSIFPEDYIKYKVDYKRPPQKISVQFENLELYDCESCSSCLSTLMLFLKRFKDDMSQYLLDDGKFHIGIGKGIKNAKEGTVFVGNCTRKNKEKGLFVPGCPPVASRIYEAIAGMEPDENEPEVS